MPSDVFSTSTTFPLLSPLQGTTLCPSISIDPDLEYCATIVAIFVVPISIAVIVLNSIYANLSIILNFALLLLGFPICSLYSGLITFLFTKLNFLSLYIDF